MPSIFCLLLFNRHNLAPIRIKAQSCLGTLSHTYTLEINIAPEQCWVLDLTHTIICNLWHQILPRHTGGLTTSLHQQAFICSKLLIATPTFTQTIKLLPGRDAKEQLRSKTKTTIRQKLFLICSKIECMQKSVLLFLWTLFYSLQTEPFIPLA